MDTVDSITRSRIMASVRRTHTGPELCLRKALHALGLRFRLHSSHLPGTPDILFPRHRIVVFVHGCFWHTHGCRLSTIPSTRRGFWMEKFRANRDRDKRVATALRRSGWKVITIWQCRLGIKGQRAERVAKAIRARLKKSKRTP